MVYKTVARNPRITADSNFFLLVGKRVLFLFVVFMCVCVELSAINDFMILVLSGYDFLEL